MSVENSVQRILNRKEKNMKKYDLCVKSGTYTDRYGYYLLIKPWINFTGFPREEDKVAELELLATSFPIL